MPSHRLKMSLLPALQAILENGSVTEAAAAMHVTQSTMSRTLAQLREALNDPLLVREGNRIYLSQKAREIKPQVSQLLSGAEELFDSKPFSPSSCQEHFRLVAGAGLQQYFLVKQLAKLSQLAPGMTFSIEVTSDLTLSGMEKGELDLGLVHVASEDCSGLRMTPVIESDWVVVVRPGHPLAQETLDDLVRLDEFSYVEIGSPLLANRFVRSYKRQSESLAKPWVRVHGVQVALELVTECDAFTVLPYPTLKEISNLRVIPLPANFIQSRLSLVWPDCWEFNHAHQWLRKFFETSLREYYLQAGAVARML